MRILDIDLDFFLSGIVYGGFTKLKSRPDSKELNPWKEEDVRRYLENNCNLSLKTKVFGKFVKKHDELFPIWREITVSKRDKIPFEVVHVDAHADLGMGDSAYHYIACELLNQEYDKKVFPNAQGMSSLDEGNYLLYAIACKWINKLTYVHHPKGGNDIPEHIMKSHDYSTNTIQLKYYGPGTNAETICSRKSQPLHLEPEVEFIKVSCDSYKSKEKFDVVFLAQSPMYCPKTSDALIPIICEYIEIEP